LILVFAVTIFFARQSTSKATAKKENGYTLKRQDLKEYLSLSGEIDAEERTVLRFQSAGRLNWVGVKEGDYVRKYQAIASLDQRDLKNKLQQTLNTFVKKRYDFDQSQDDTERIGDQVTREAGDKMKRILDKAQYDLNNSIIDVELGNLALEYSNLITPIEGIVTRVDIKYSGVNITPAQAEFEIINPKTLYFLATADQTEVVKLKNKMSAKITMDSYLDDEFDGQILDIGFIPKTGETSTVYKVKITLPKDVGESQFKIGMTGDVSFLVKEKNNVLSVPSQYIKNNGDKKYVWTKVNDKRQKTYIKTGEEIDDNTVIISGLKEGDTVYD